MFDDENIKIIVATNMDPGIRNVSIGDDEWGEKGSLVSNVKSFNMHLKLFDKREINLNSHHLYAVVNPPKGGGFPFIYDLFNKPPEHIKRIYSKGLMCDIILQW